MNSLPPHSVLRKHPVLVLLAVLLLALIAAISVQIEDTGTSVVYQAF